MNIKPFYFSLFVALIFFVICFITIRDYGVSWDEAIHFRRGQAYLHYYLTGRSDYSSLPSYNLQGTNGDPEKQPYPKRSFYQNDYHNGEFFFKDDAGHPPLGDILAATLNYVFFQKLGLLSDIDSFHLFNILTSSLLVFCVAYFAATTFGIFVGLIAILSLISYPLFFAESHFNIKDPAQAAFFSLTILCIYKFLELKKYIFMLGAFLGLTFSLGIKFNIIFLPFIVIPFAYLNFKRLKTELRKKKFYTYLTVGVVMSLIIFIAFWPYLWANPISNLYSVLKYYKEIGSGFNYQPSNFYILGFNFFPPLWILYTTPPVVLLLMFIGVISAYINRNKYHYVTILWLLWFFIPVVRASLPGFSIYGGIRQIMEFLPAMSLLVGLGAFQLIKITEKNIPKYKGIVLIALILIFFYPIFVIIKMHPYQNIYFNQLIGGLSGAKQVNFPSWGNSLGSPYLQGIEWLNKNVERKAKVALIQGTPANAPLIFFREDINFDNSNWSGINKDGEYLMDLIFNDTGKSFHYAWEYVDKFLVPVYEVKVDNVAILKIWKNDSLHTGKQYLLKEEDLTEKLEKEVLGKAVIINLKKTYLLSRLKMSFPLNNCEQIKNSYIETSIDNNNWVREKDEIPFRQVGYEFNLKDNNLTYFFPGTRAQYIRFVVDSESSCGLNSLKDTVTILKEI